jgi:hypothetical protein
MHRLEGEPLVKGIGARVHPSGRGDPRPPGLESGAVPGAALATAIRTVRGSAGAVSAGGDARV